MAAKAAQLKGWGDMVDPPKLTNREWNMVGILGVVLIVMAILQVIGFSDFKDWLSSIGLGSPSIWAVVLVLAEVLAAVGFFKLKLMKGLRAVSSVLAVLVAGFWFVENLRLVAQANAGELTNSGFFGKFLHQSPGWWTVVEVTVFLFWTIYAVKLTWPKN